MAAGDRLLVTSLLPECDASHASSRASVIYAAPPPPPPLPGLPGLPDCPFVYQSRYLDFLDFSTLCLCLEDSSPDHLGSCLGLSGLPAPSGDSKRESGSKRTHPSSQYQLAPDHELQHHQSCQHQHHRRHHRHHHHHRDVYCSHLRPVCYGRLSLRGRFMPRSGCW